MRAHVGHLRRRVHWVYQVFVLSMVASMATGCVGAWRAISTGDFLASVQVMGLAWLVLLATVAVLHQSSPHEGSTRPTDWLK